MHYLIRNYTIVNRNNDLISICSYKGQFIRQMIYFEKQLENLTLIR